MRTRSPLAGLVGPLVVALIVALIVAVAATSAFAHQNTIAYSTIVVTGDDVAWQVAISENDVGAAAGTGEGVFSRQDLPQFRDKILGYVAAKIAVRRGVVPCDLGRRELVASGEGATTYFTTSLRWKCPVSDGPLVLRYDLFFELDPRHQSVVDLTVERDRIAETLTADRRELVLSGGGRLVKYLAHFVQLGTEHILTGFDHLAFLLALLLVLVVAPRERLIRDAIRTITAFTIAHSVTLLAAAFGCVRLRSYWVEASIAASIVAVALWNLRRTPPRARSLATFVFGLIHGLGFAAILAETTLPRDARVASVLAFNVGVELGQLGVLAMLTPVVWWARRRSDTTRRRIVDVSSVLLALLGIGWLVLRLRSAS